MDIKKNLVLLNKNSYYIAKGEYMKKSIFVISLFLTLFSCMSDGKNSEISGYLEAGLRVINIEDYKDLDLTVYRGDYIVFNPGKNKTAQLLIPDIKVDTQIPIQNKDTQYIKMKEAGRYEFTVDSKKGVINVIELDANNYYEVKSADALKLIENVNPFILDVRTPGEYGAGHLVNSHLLPVQVLQSEISKLEKYKDEPVLVYCASGNRSTVAAKILTDAGFSKVYNLRYGYSDWQAGGYPVE